MSTAFATAMAEFICFGTRGARRLVLLQALKYPIPLSRFAVGFTTADVDLCGRISTMPLTRRRFLALSAASPWALRPRASRPIPIGLELYSVREVLKQDLEGTLRSIAKMGYQCVEFYAPYFEWSESQTRQIRKLLMTLACDATPPTTTRSISR
jgi:hypothetical protein